MISIAEPNDDDDEEEDGFGDDFDDFEEGEQGADDFDAFDDEFEESADQGPEATPSLSILPPASYVSHIDIWRLSSYLQVR